MKTYLYQEVYGHKEITEWVPADVARELLEALDEALVAIKEYVEYTHDGDPWSEDARVMGEMELDDYGRDGRMQKALSLIEKNNK